jgi:hypothetical protein
VVIVNVRRHKPHYRLGGRNGVHGNGATPSLLHIHPNDVATFKKRDPSKGHLHAYSSPSGFIRLPLSLGGRCLRWAQSGAMTMSHVALLPLFGVSRLRPPNSTLDDTHDGWAPSPPSPSLIRERKGIWFLMGAGARVNLFNMCRIWYLNSAHPAHSYSYPGCRVISVHLGRSSQV